MKILKKALVPFAILPLKNISYAQKRDSIPIKVRAFIADKFPQTRDLYADFTQVTPHHFSSKLMGTDLPENKMKSFQQLKAGANIYFFQKENLDAEYFSELPVYGIQYRNTCFTGSEH